MIFENQSELKDRIESITNKAVKKEIIIQEDTSEYLDITRGMVLRLEGNDYVVTGNAREGRFGLHEEPKYWVKYAYDLSNGEYKVLKLVFYEEFSRRLGRFIVKNFRNPDKESAVLDIVKDHPHFMHGKTVTDIKGNNIRVIDFIKGDPLFSYITEIKENHETYFFKTFPHILKWVITSVEAMDFLSSHGQHHGDIRNDHIIIEKDTGVYRWIDFDYQVNYPDYDLWSIGNIIVYTAGKGIHSFHSIKANEDQYPAKVMDITDDDSLLFYKYRIANLKKLFPYIPKKINDTLLRFSSGTSNFYDNFRQQVEDLQEALSFFKLPEDPLGQNSSKPEISGA